MLLAIETARRAMNTPALKAANAAPVPTAPAHPAPAPVARAASVLRPPLPPHRPRRLSSSLPPPAPPAPRHSCASPTPAGRDGASCRPAGSDPSTTGTDRLPATIGGALRAAAAKGEAAAEFEIAEVLCRGPWHGAEFHRGGPLVRTCRQAGGWRRPSSGSPGCMRRALGFARTSMRRAASTSPRARPDMPRRCTISPPCVSRRGHRRQPASPERGQMVPQGGRLRHRRQPVQPRNSLRPAASGGAEPDRGLPVARLAAARAAVKPPKSATTWAPVSMNDR